ncbi:hypothetical protein NE236_25805 [Actinoallomurus purpureus]|uniref:hypothetical protein n=1 Tax=Actinoallomurus purpureus TaxID=478114 RepID=UPI0020938728|nr:hypothetical protein [Actinoallomurus purpureus]MCO6008397.1 hypothetical protein [Actinoallomurus purpureus]
MQFIVMVDGDADEVALLRCVLKNLPDAVRLKAHSCDVRGNWLEIWQNEDADPNLAENDDDGYLYYRWRVELTPMGGTVDEDHQVELARALIGAFERADGRAVVLANFEDRV